MFNVSSQEVSARVSESFPRTLNVNSNYFDLHALEISFFCETSSPVPHPTTSICVPPSAKLVEIRFPVGGIGPGATKYLIKQCG